MVSRIEVQSYSHSHARALALTVDAAVNSGNSGGPVLSQTSGEVIGIAFQGYAGSDIEGQGHAVPAPIIGRFLKAYRASLGAEASGLPSLGVHLQWLQSPAARARLAMRPGDTGVLVSHVDHNGSSQGLLQRGDVLLAVDGEARRRTPAPLASLTRSHSRRRRPRRQRSPCTHRTARVTCHGVAHRAADDVARGGGCGRRLRTTARAGCTARASRCWRCCTATTSATWWRCACGARARSWRWR